jgi:prepilin-type N-terminal cleavage/methylation domain-containing protein
MSGAGLGGYTARNIQRALPLRGVTLLEMIAVLTIFLILTASVVAGYTNAERGLRLAKASERVLTALNYTKNAAISNNGVAFLEIIDVGDGRRLLKIHVFPNVADALKVNGEPAANTMVPNSFSNTPAQLLNLAPNAWSPKGKPNYVEPASIAYQDANPAIAIPGTGMAYNNWLADTQVMETGISVGIDPPSASILDGILIGFNPDGTLTGNPTKVYITDDTNFFYADQATIDKAISQKNPRLKAIAIYGGGLIRQEL